jgi:O-antigen/teichoic acid export membrane protein
MANSVARVPLGEPEGQLGSSESAALEQDPTAITPVSGGLVQRLLTQLRTNHMVRNSMFSLLSTGLQAALGFAFWVIAARIFTAPDVGRATSLISATTFIGSIALFGLNSTLSRFLPTTKSRDLMITSSVVIVAVGGTIFALAYVIALPLIAPQLRFMDARIPLAIGFVLLTGTATVNKLTDYIFVASRRTGINAFVDGGIGGVSRLILLPILASTGAYGLFSASTGGFAITSVASVILLWTHLHTRPRLKGALKEMRPLLRFSGANYLGNVFNLVPILVMSLIVLDRLGTSAAAYYYMAFQIANLLYSGVYAVEENFLAEGAHDEEALTHLMWRAGKLLAMMALPAALVGALLAHYIMLVFGHPYAVHGSGALVLMALATIPIAAQNWLITVMRLTGQLMAITVSNFVYAVAICGLAWVLAPHGLAMVGASWLFGSLLSVMVGIVAVLMGKRRGALTPS